MARRHRKLPHPKPQQIARFWSKVDKTPGQGPNGDCWEWTGRKLPDGYAIFSLQRHDSFYVHRIAYLLQTGIDPLDNLVCHKCDNRACCRCDHFFLGTDKDNVRDCIQKRRRAPMPDRPKGTQNSHAILTETDVLEIRRLRAQGMLLREITKRYNVRLSTIQHICSRRTWKHI